MEPLSSQQKIAETLLVLSPQDAANVLKTLDERELIFAGNAILTHAHRTYDTPEESIKNIINTQPTANKSTQHTNDANTNDSNVQSFLKITANDFSELEVVKALYRIAFGAKRSQELIRKLLHNNLRTKLSFLNNYSVSQLYEAISKESKQVISIVLSVLKPTLSAELLNLFKEQERYEIIVRITNQQMPQEQVLKILEESLRRKLANIVITEQEKENPDGEQNLVQILENLHFQAQETILESLEDPELKERVLYKLSSWKDVVQLRQKEIEGIVEEYSNEDLAKLLLIDGIDARNTMQTIVSANRMLLIEDELEKLYIDFSSQVHAIKDATIIKKQFFHKVRQLLSLITN